MPLNRCASILSSVWNGNACVCNPGYSVVGVQCACLGLAVNSTFCDRCFNNLIQCLSTVFAGVMMDSHKLVDNADN